MRLLLAIANHDLRLSLQLLLSEQPSVEIVGTASEGEGLLALMHVIQPDMILTDWDLPGRPLTTVLQKADPTHPPKIILLASDYDDCQLISEQIQVDAIVLKGASPDVLLNTFHQIRTNQQEGDSL